MSIADQIVYLIKQNIITIDDVALKYREEVKKILEGLNK